MFKKKSLLNKIFSVIFNLLWIALGIYAICSPSGFGRSLGIVAGSFMIVIGTLILLFALFSSTLVIGSGFMALQGGLTLALGIFLVVYNESTLTMIVFVLAFYFLINGIIKAVSSIEIRKLKSKTWWITLLLGLSYIALSIVLFIYSNDEVASSLIGSFFIINGILGLFELLDTFKREKRESTIIKNINKNMDDLDHIDIDFTKK